MTISRSEDLLVGLISLGLVPWILWTVQRGLRDGRLPIGRSYVARDERRSAYAGLLAFYLLAAGFMALIAMDLLLGLDLKERL